MTKIYLTILVIFSFCLTAKSQFDYLKIKKQQVITTHQLQYKIKINKSFKFLGEFHHQPIYGKKEFNVSMAAFSDKKKLIMIHAETHTDKSGGLDYSNFPAISLSNLKFTTREQCTTSEDEAELSTNPQIEFIRKKGFNLTLPFFFKQYFATDSEGKSEIVISYGRQVSSCDEKTISTEFKKQIEVEITENIQVKKSL